MRGITPRASKNTKTITCVDPKSLKDWLKKSSPSVQSWIKDQGFQADPGQSITLPGPNGIAGVVFAPGPNPTLWNFADLPARVPAGEYAFDDTLPSGCGNAAGLGWLLACYAYDRYKTNKSPPPPSLVWPQDADRKEVLRLAHGTCMARDLVNTPAEDLGPRQLAQFAAKLAKSHKATIKVIQGKTLQKEFPAIHAVGRAATADRQPLLIDMSWGRKNHRAVTLVGKGVVFDSGGLDLKSADGMRLMKKDMGGAAAVLGVAHAIMDAKLAVRLRVLIPAVENSIGANAYRPGDVIKTRKGLQVEIGNTDAEGRVILCDALALACESKSDLVIDFATLTGAARVALGTELPALFCNNDPIAEHILAGGQDDGDFDPLWRMPLFAPYDRHLASPIADLNNIDNVGKGGAITAALYLQRFVTAGMPWAHIDTMAYNSASLPGRPVGGEGLAVRAVYRAIKSFAATPVSGKKPPK